MKDQREVPVFRVGVWFWVGVWFPARVKLSMSLHFVVVSNRNNCCFREGTFCKNVSSLEQSSGLGLDSWKVQYNQFRDGHQVHPSIMQAIMKLVQVLQSELRAALEVAGRHCTEDIPKMLVVDGCSWLLMVVDGC